jgi:hypothetical protein
MPPKFDRNSLAVKSSTRFFTCLRNWKSIIELPLIRFSKLSVKILSIDKQVVTLCFHQFIYIDLSTKKWFRHAFFLLLRRKDSLFRIKCVCSFGEKLVFVKMRHCTAFSNFSFITNRAWWNHPLRGQVDTQDNIIER